MKQDMIVICLAWEAQRTQNWPGTSEMGVYSRDLSPRYHSQRTEGTSQR